MHFYNTSGIFLASLYCFLLSYSPQWVIKYNEAKISPASLKRYVAIAQVIAAVVIITDNF